tara:strand:+ start:93 stop:323 length:231 start_codon:yes stop_codon:yes gene_type:complete
MVGSKFHASAYSVGDSRGKFTSVSDKFNVLISAEALLVIVLGKKFIRVIKAFVKQLTKRDRALLVRCCAGAQSCTK